MKKFGLVIIMVLIVIASSVFIIFYGDKEITSLTIKEDFETGFVTKVIDGDTVVINGESYRLLGMDTDERGYDCYKEAKGRMEELVLNKEVKLESDERDKDIYDRYLRYLIVDGENINLKMVEEGLAIARFYEDKKYREEILTAERKARENRLGCKWRNI